jgi:DNA excision repair protein ERCC-2
MSEVLFPYEEMRPIQKDVIATILKGIEGKKGVVIHAPTGLGKTVASIAPALTKGLEDDKTIIFLTSRNTQHKIAIDTVKAIKDHTGKNIIATDIIGKKWMCLQAGVHNLSSGEFSEYCKALREDKKCEYYENFKQGEKITPITQLAKKELLLRSPVSVELLLEKGEEHKLCPYELGMLIAKESNIIITDYYYMFHPRIRENFLKKNDIKLEDCIIIIDEAHNLPNRIKDLASQRLSTTILQRAAKEAAQYNNESLIKPLESLFHLVKELLPQQEDEKYIDKETFLLKSKSFMEYTSFIEECYKIADKIREDKKISAIGSVAAFLEAWLDDTVGFTRIVSKRKNMTGETITLSYRCLDPSVVSRPVIEQSYTTIAMSGTLTPTNMYSELLGFGPDTIQEEFPSPFPKENQLNLIVAKTSTKYTARSATQFKDIADIVTEIANATPGNSMIFFPSYFVKDQVEKYLTQIEKTVFIERPEMSSNDKDEMIAAFKTYKKHGAVLLGVVSGSFGEGLDLPGDELKTVVVVGLPLSRPDLETKALIEYYDTKFKSGWNYGYIFPAFNRIIQNAGRCIRSPTDRGVIVFLDERYTWDKYYRCFPKSWKMKISVNHYKEQIEKFFSQPKQI